MKDLLKDVAARLRWMLFARLLSLAVRAAPSRAERAALRARFGETVAEIRNPTRPTVG